MTSYWLFILITAGALAVGWLCGWAFTDAERTLRLDMQRIDYEYRLRLQDIQHKYDMGMLAIEHKYGSKEQRA